MLDRTAATTIDAFLNGRVEVVQPAHGHHRSGLDALMLGASLGGGTQGRVADLGAGAGAAGMTLAARAAAISVVLVEREAELALCASETLRREGNRGFSDRVSIAAVDLFAGDTGLRADSFDHVIMNPPFHDAGSVRSSPNGARARAHILDGDGLDAWFRAAARLVRPRGTLSVILPADRLPGILAGCDGRFGELTILPLHARDGDPALRVIARGIKASRAPIRLLPGLVLHDVGTDFTANAQRIFRDGAALADIVQSWPADPISGRPMSRGPS